jgi:hypothetical protein
MSQQNNRVDDILEENKLNLVNHICFSPCVFTIFVVKFQAQFKQFDRDGDKKITLQEYLIAMGQVPEAYHKYVRLWYRKTESEM